MLDVLLSGAKYQFVKLHQLTDTHLPAVLKCTGRKKNRSPSLFLKSPSFRFFLGDSPIIGSEHNTEGFLVGF